MEALSPRSTNILPKPKTDPMTKAGAEDAQPQKARSAKNHAPPPPPTVREPEEGGEEYITGKFLGKGGFAVCYEGRLARSNKVYAMKVVKSEMNQKKMEEKVWTKDTLVTCPSTLQCLTSARPVPNRAPNTFENVSSQYRGFL